MSKTIFPFTVTQGGCSPEIIGKEWYISGRDDERSIIRLNTSGQLWATAGEEDRGVCLAYLPEHFEQLVRIMTEAKKMVSNTNPA